MVKEREYQNPEQRTEQVQQYPDSSSFYFQCMCSGFLLIRQSGFTNSNWHGTLNQNCLDEAVCTADLSVQYTHSDAFDIF